MWICRSYERFFKARLLPSSVGGSDAAGLGLASRGHVEPPPARGDRVKLPHEHAQRRQFNDEVHARPPESLIAPLRISYMALYTEGEARDEGWGCVQRLAEHFGATPPETHAHHFSANLGPFRIKCERHTEFLRFKFMADGAADDPFNVPVLDRVSPEWVASLPGELIVAANVALLRGMKDLDFDQIATEHFDGHALIGAKIAGGAATAVTDFRIHADGFSRFLIVDQAMTARQAGRMVQRLLEMETYRILSLMALPLARELSPVLLRSERELAAITRSLVNAADADEAMLFNRLTRLEAEIESKQSENLHRFSAAAAYHGLVLQRIAELREERLPGFQTFKEFTERRLAPAMNTCRSVAAQQESLSQRLARVTQLLSTRVGITREQQNQRVLESMNRRAEQQLRLQQTVEGLSVAAIAYYIVGLVGYAAKGLKAAGVRLEIDIVIAISIPVIVVLTAFALRRIRHRVAREL